MPENGLNNDAIEDDITNGDLVAEIENQQDQTAMEAQQQTIKTLADQLGRQQQAAASQPVIVEASEAKETPKYLTYIVIGIVIFLFVRS